jgi:hypothetical protein
MEYIKRYTKTLFIIVAGLLMMAGCGIFTFTPSTTPVANAGADQNVPAGSTVTLNGNASTSRTDSPLSFTWTQTRGTPVTLTGSNTATATFVAPDQSGTLSFQLVVSDANGTSRPDTVVISISVPTSESPVANAGADQNVSVGSTVTLNGNASTSRTGSPLSFTWTQTGGSPVILTDVNTATPSFTAPSQAETLTFQLVTSDVNGMSTPDTVVINVGTTTSMAPIANAGADQNVPAGSQVALNGNTSISQTGSPLTFAWTQIGGTPITLTNANTATPSFTAPNQAETLTFELVVQDINGPSTPDTMAISTVVPTPSSPVANAGPDRIAPAGTAVALNGTASTSVTGSPLSFAWTQTSGTPVSITGANTATPSFTAPNQADNLTFQLVVSDANGVSNPDTVGVTVTAPPVASVCKTNSENRILSFFVLQQ